MQVTVLGNSAMFPGPGRACSGYLVVEGETSILLDCGTGVLSNLQQRLSVRELTAIIISHMHPDHFLDLIPLRYALKYGNHGGPHPLPVYFPPGGAELWKRVVSPFAEPGNSFSDIFEIREYQEGETCRVGGLGLRFRLLKHYVPNYGIEVHGRVRLAYSGDTAPCDEIADLANKADMFICEATWLEDHAPAGQRGHLTAEEAALFAKKAGACQLLVTHVANELDPARALETANRYFGPGAFLAVQGETFSVKSA